MNRLQSSKLFLGVLIGVLLISILAFAPTAIRYFNGAIFVNGIRDENQLTVQGWTTQTTNLLVLEQSDGTDVFTVTNAGALGYSGSSTFSGDTSILGTLLVDGQADSVQVTAQGYTTQTTNLFTAEQFDGTDVLTITNAGALGIASTLNVAGNTTLAALLFPSTNALTLTIAGQFVTPTTSIQILDSTGDISMTLAPCAIDGRSLQVYGKDANTITINDTNIRTTDGNAATLGQYDIIGWECHDTEWIHQYKSANQ